MTDTERTRTIQGLRTLADFFEAHPGVPVPWHMQVDVFVETKAELATIARQTTWEKQYRDTWFTLHRDFGTVSLEVNIEREKVCRRVVTGTEVLPARPAQVVDTFEWRCDDALLSSTGAHPPDSDRMHTSSGLGE